MTCLKKNHYILKINLYSAKAQITVNGSDSISQITPLPKRRLFKCFYITVYGPVLDYCGLSLPSL